MSVSGHKQRGFALLVVMMVVALMAITAAALLDVVNVDLGIAAEYSKSIDAEAASIGAVVETVGMPDFEERLPPPDSAELRTRYVTRNGSNYVIDPDGIHQTTTLVDGASAYIKNVGGFSEDGYESDVKFIKLVPMEDTTLSMLIPVYEVRAKASVAGGDATRESRALIYLPTPVEASRVPVQRHAR